MATEKEGCCNEKNYKSLSFGNCEQIMIVTKKIHTKIIIGINITCRNIRIDRKIRIDKK